jgi:flagellin
MVVNTNVLSLVTQTNVNNNQKKLNTAVEQLSSGLRINNASDDPAGLAIGNRMMAQVNGMNQAVNNANNAIGLAQVGDGALASIGNMLQQMNSLAVEAANGTNSSTDLSNLNTEFTALASEITREIGATTFNGQAILTTTTGITYQVGPNAGNVITGATVSSYVSAGATNMSAVLSGNLLTTSAASSALANITNALNDVNTARAQFGANQIQFQQVVSTLQIDAQNTSAAESQIMDTNYAQATSQLTQAEIVQQAGTSMLSQANSLPQSVMTLLSKLP